MGKASYGRGTGFLTREDYRGIFRRYINDHRNLWLRLAKPLTAEEKRYLLSFYPARLVEQVRVYEMAGMTGAFIHNASATTYGADFIIFKQGSRTLSTLKHEFVHVCQYDRLGVDGFATAYADMFVDGGYEYRNIEFEKQAFAFQGRRGPIKSFLGYCE